MITLKELSAKCGVSIATVSNILNGKSNVSEETKTRVLKVIEETGYRPNVMASRLRAHKTKTIGLIIDELCAFSSPDLIDGVLSYLEKNGYQAIIEDLRLYIKWNNKPNSKEYKLAVTNSVEKMLSIKVDGIIFIAAHAHDIEYFTQTLPVPIVIAYGYHAKNVIPAVRIDDTTSAYEITKFIISKGHTKIGLIGGTEDTIHLRDRFEGYRKALEEAGLSVNRSYVYGGNWDRESGYESARKMLTEHGEITAIFCFNDLMAAGAYDYLMEINKVPGRDIAVAGFDNRELSAYLNPPLTTMEIELGEIGFKAAEVLLKKINGIELKEEDLLIPCRLIERSSV